MSVLSHKNESRIKSCSKTDENTKTNMAGLVAVTYNKKPTYTENFVAFETGKNDRN